MSWDAARLLIWVVYDHPKDFPDLYVARLHFSLPEPEVSAIAVGSSSLEAIREFLRHRGCTQLARFPDDDPVIVETWIE